MLLLLLLPLPLLMLLQLLLLVFPFASAAPALTHALSDPPTRLCCSPSLSLPLFWLPFVCQFSALGYTFGPLFAVICRPCLSLSLLLSCSLALSLLSFAFPFSVFGRFLSFSKPVSFCRYNSTDVSRRSSSRSTQHPHSLICGF